MSTETNLTTTTGADAIDVAIANGIDFDGSPIPPAKLELYHRVMGLEAGRQRSGVSNTMRSRIVRIGAKHIPQEELNQLLLPPILPLSRRKKSLFTYNVGFSSLGFTSEMKSSASIEQRSTTKNNSNL